MENYRNGNLRCHWTLFFGFFFSDSFLNDERKWLEVFVCRDNSKKIKCPLKSRDKAGTISLFFSYSKMYAAFLQPDENIEKKKTFNVNFVSALNAGQRTNQRELKQYQLIGQTIRLFAGQSNACQMIVLVYFHVQFVQIQLNCFFFFVVELVSMTRRVFHFHLNCVRGFTTRRMIKKRTVIDFDEMCVNTRPNWNFSFSCVRNT